MSEFEKYKQEHSLPSKTDKKESKRPIYCSKCGNKIQIQDGTFCTFCGEKIIDR